MNKKMCRMNKEDASVDFLSPQYTPMCTTNTHTQIAKMLHTV